MLYGWEKKQGQGSWATTSGTFTGLSQKCNFGYTNDVTYTNYATNVLILLSVILFRRSERYYSGLLKM